jgi:hypothetical protein
MIASTSEIGSADDSLGFWDFWRFLKKDLKIGIAMRTATSAGSDFRDGLKDYRLTYHMKDYRVDCPGSIEHFG